MPIWFYDDDPSENAFDASELSFLDGLREHAATWAQDGVSTYAIRNEESGALTACMELMDATGTLLDVRAHVADQRVRSDRSYGTDSEPTTLVMRAEGSTAELVSITATWFEALLHRPIERLEWWHNNLLYAMRCQFTDTQEGLREVYDRKLAPPGQYERLIDSASFRGRSWIRTIAIGDPDRTYAVRSSGNAHTSLLRPGYPWYVCPLETPETPPSI